MSKILVVDDQFGVRLLLVEIFQDDNHEVKMAVNGFEALQLLSSFEPALILLDMKMPGMNGIETLEKIRDLDRRVTVIMMTGNDDPHNIEQEKNLGILCYITKPFDLFKLKEQVREILNMQNLSVV
ncbi:response regulator [Desulfosporosinus metallidurans]|uniref:Stage 0 sporulation protein A homolog n=1 Tax=Desulfosporosinus metallidurans TaxID=1888891 RepID=A0A1Q8QF27_9FIRM|nr:response regulator [Desulfosporosinus metallidurans]OLN25959.1 Sporulation initiation phosphotransferase (Spo0F) [Desulfosporosinus metallidurans]